MQWWPTSSRPLTSIFVPASSSRSSMPPISSTARFPPPSTRVPGFDGRPASEQGKVSKMTDVVVPLVTVPRRIDAIDRRILKVLQQDASLTVAEIGERVGLSSTPCWKRIQRMEGEGIITGKVALVDQNKIGLGLSVFVSVESADHSDAWLQKFARAVGNMPEVIELYRMAGDVDYMLRVVVKDMQSYDGFYKKLIGAVALKNVTSRFAMEKIKSVTALPVPEVEAA